MKKLLAVLSVVVFVLPVVVFAAKDDVSMDTSVVLSVDGIEVDISGSTATVESITVGASSFSFDLQSGSSIQVTAPGRNILGSDKLTDVVTNTCNSSQSILKFVGTGARTITVTPSTALCATSGGSSGRSGSGSGSQSTSPKVTPAIPAVNASGLSAAQVQTILDLLGSFNVDTATLANVKSTLQGSTTGSITSVAVQAFKADLTLGSLGSEVKALQMFLNAHGYPVAASGAGSLGHETTTFGSATKAALIKYQKTKGITPASGFFGAKTRAAVNAER